VNKLLIGLALGAFVLIGSVGVWMASGDDRRVGAISALEEPVALSWRGAWTESAKYDVGQVVSFEGGSYVAEAPNDGLKPGAKEGPWALMAAPGQSAGSFDGTFQSPNGSYSLVVSDNGIVMQGPEGRVSLNSDGLTLVAAGPMAVTTGGSLAITVGQTFATNVGGSSVLDVGKNLSTSVGQTSATSIAGASNLSVGKSFSTNVGQNLVTSVGGTGTVSFAKAFSWNVDEDFLLNVGGSATVNATSGIAAVSSSQVNVRGSVVRLNCGTGSSARPVARQHDQVAMQSPSAGQVMQGSPTVLSC
jgi:hypothetical protein